MDYIIHGVAESDVTSTFMISFFKDYHAPEGNFKNCFLKHSPSDLSLLKKILFLFFGCTL